MKMNLTDTHQRLHNYLRISLTDKCNLRCTYCMPFENMQFTPTALQMNAEELLDITHSFVKAGVNKIRLTGGEPLVRKDIDKILRGLSKFPVSLAMTTNAVKLHKHFDLLEETNCTKLNISLDTLDKTRFFEITRRNDFDQVLENILEAKKRGFDIKVNTVLIKGTNDDEVLSLLKFFAEKEISLRFIEFMPFKDNKWDKSKMVSEDEILEQVYHEFGKTEIEELPVPAHATAREYKLPGAKVSFGVISSVTNPFCDTCNRLRLTADGKLKNCLFSNNEADLLKLHRDGQDITPAVNLLVANKAAVRAGMVSSELFENKETHQKNRSMVRIGG